MASLCIFGAITNRLIDKLSTILWRWNLQSLGEGSVVQKGVCIRYPGQISIGTGVNIGRNVNFGTEISSSTLFIGDNSQINKGVRIDFTGEVSISNNVVVSENTIIFSHSHGYDPKSNPVKKSLFIEDNVWIGAGCIITENVNSIGKNSLIAAGSVVIKDVVPNSIVGGNPAKYIKQKKLGD